VFISPGILIIGLWVLFEKKADGEKFIDQMPKSMISISAIIITVSSFIGGYWYIRNWFLLGNPFYPSQFKLFGHVIYQGISYFQDGIFRLQSLNNNLSSLFNIRLFDSGLYNPDLPYMAGWGWFACSIGLISLLVGIITSRFYRWLAAGFILSLFLLLGWANSDPWYMRFTLWFPAVFVFGYGIVMKKMKYNFIKTCFSILSVICVLMNFLGTMSHGYGDLKRWKYFVNIPFFERSASHCGSSYAYVTLDKIVPKGEAIGYFTGGGNSTIYSLYGSGYLRRVHFLNLRKIVDVTKEMERLDLHYLYVEAGHIAKNIIDSLVAENKLVKKAEHIYYRA